MTSGHGDPPDAEPQSTERGAVHGQDPSAERPAAERAAADTPAGSGHAADPRSAEPGTGEAGRADERLTASPPPPRLSGGRAAAPLFGDTPFDEPLTGEVPGRDVEATDPYAHAHAAEAPSIVDDAPTEAIPAAAAAAGRHRADPDEDADLVTAWRAPRQTSRMTMVLLAALLVALGFFAGVLVGRSAGVHTPSDDTARPTATGPARPGALR
jgi:hypothetical protein